MTKPIDSSTAAATATTTAVAVAATNAANLSKDIEYIKRDVAEIKISVKEIIGIYATKEEISLIQKIIFGLVTADIAIIGWLVTVALRK